MNDRLTVDTITSDQLDALQLQAARMSHAVQQYAELRVQMEDAERERDGAYRERAHLVALLAAMTDGAVIVPALDLAEAGWWIVYLNLGGRQASWHISPRDAGLFAGVEHVDVDDPRAQWDGHTTEEKYAGITAHTVELMARCGPECSEMHTETGRCEIARNRRPALLAGVRDLQIPEPQVDVEPRHTAPEDVPLCTCTYGQRCPNCRD